MLYVYSLQFTLSHSQFSFSSPLIFFSPLVFTSLHPPLSFPLFLTQVSFLPLHSLFMGLSHIHSGARTASKNRYFFEFVGGIRPAHVQFPRARWHFSKNLQTLPILALKNKWCFAAYSINVAAQRQMVVQNNTKLYWNNEPVYFICLSKFRRQI